MSHPKGTFCWADLSSTDLEAAKAFYGRVLGWSYRERPTSQGAYWLAVRDDAVVAGVYRGEADRWNSYVALDSADDVPAEHVVMGPFEVEGIARIVVFKDPGGAVLCGWEPRGLDGAERLTAPGALCWNELETDEPEAVKRFYADLLGWTYDGETIMVGDRPNGAIRTTGQEPAWGACFAVDDLEAALEDVAKVVVPPTEMAGLGTYAVAADPQGAVFALYAGRLEPRGD